MIGISIFLNLEIQIPIIERILSNDLFNLYLYKNHYGFHKES